MNNRRTILIAAIVLALVSTIGFFAYSKSLDKRVERVVATVNIPQGIAIEESMVKLEKIHPDNVVEGSFQDIDPILGKKAEYPIEKGEQVLASRVSGIKKKTSSIADTLPSSLVALGIPVDLSQCVGGQIAAHDKITIYINTKGGLVKYHNVEVVKVVNKEGKDANSTSEGDKKKSSEPAVVIVQVDNAKAEAISPHVGEAKFVLALESSKEG